MDRPLPTADLCDQYESRITACPVQFRQFGGVHSFAGEVTTVHSPGDNLLLRELLATPGRGRVIVVDGGGRLDCTLLGDRLAGLAADNGWSGLVIFGAVRDVTALAEVPIGVKALGANPVRSTKLGTGEVDVPVVIGGTRFAPGAELVSDDDGVVLLPT